MSLDAGTQIFILSAISMGLAFFGVFLRQVCRQRCDSISCLGLNIHRDVALENRENELRTETGREFSPRASMPSTALTIAEHKTPH